MGSLGPQELLVIVFIGLLVFGPDRLPEMARNVGKFVARLRQETGKSIAELKRVADLDGIDKELSSLTRDLRDVKGTMKRALMDATDAAGSAAKAASASPDRVAARPTPAPYDPDAT